MSTFSETHRAFRVWLVAILAAVWCGFIFFTVIVTDQQIVKGIPFGDKPMQDNELIVFLIFFNLIFMFFEAMIVLIKMEVSIDKYGISYSYFPFVGKRTIQRSEIKYVYVENYRSLRNKRKGLKYIFKNKELNVFEKSGIQIIKENGKSILLGTGKPEVVRTVLSELGYKGRPEYN